MPRPFFTVTRRREQAINDLLICIGRLVRFEGFHFFGSTLAANVVITILVFLGVLLFIAGLAYLAECVAWLLMPALGPVVGKLASPLRALELAMPLWLLIMGAKDQPLAD